MTSPPLVSTKSWYNNRHRLCRATYSYKFVIVYFMMYNIVVDSSAI